MRRLLTWRPCLSLSLALRALSLCAPLGLFVCARVCCWWCDEGSWGTSSATAASVAAASAVVDQVSRIRVWKDTSVALCHPCSSSGAQPTCVLLLTNPGSCLSLSLSLSLSLRLLAHLFPSLSCFSFCPCPGACVGACVGRCVPAHVIVSSTSQQRPCWHQQQVGKRAPRAAATLPGAALPGGAATLRASTRLARALHCCQVPACGVARGGAATKLHPSLAGSP